MASSSHKQEAARSSRAPPISFSLPRGRAGADVREWVGAHHERPDGRGYPRGISGDDLGIEPRILAVADAYEAMTSDRSYRASIGTDDARAELRRGAGTQFDADAAAALLTVLDREAAIARAA